MKNETIEQAAHRILTQYGIKSIGQSIGVIKVQELMVEMDGNKKECIVRKNFFKL
jgi:hypothetical protein